MAGQIKLEGQFTGYISRQHTVWCGRCGAWDQASSNTIARMEKIARRNGWKKLGELGWCCPTCVAALKAK